MAALAGNNADGIFLLAVVIPMIVASAVVLYFTNLRPLRTKSPEEAVRYLRDHSWRKYRNDDLITFARRYTTRLGKSHRRPFLIFFTVISTLWIAFAIVRVAMGDTKFALFYFAPGLMLVSACAFSWYFEYIIRTQIAVFNRYLDEAKTMPRTN